MSIHGNPHFQAQAAAVGAALADTLANLTPTKRAQVLAILQARADNYTPRGYADPTGETAVRNLTKDRP